MNSIPAFFTALAACEVVDISQPVSEKTACFPGDTPFQQTLQMTVAESGVLNLTAFTMSPHVGTHADAPGHVRGDVKTSGETVAQQPLQPYFGPCVVIDVAPCAEPITPEQVQGALERWQSFPERILFRTQTQVRSQVFEAGYASLSVELIEYLAKNQVKLVGLDTPSVDPVTSKTLAAHHALLAAGVCWLENLDLTEAQSETVYFLMALPLRFETLEASPLRAVLLKAP